MKRLLKSKLAVLSLLCLFTITINNCGGGSKREQAETPPPPPPAELSVSKEGDGNGTVTSNPSGINCGTDCSELYDIDTSIELFAEADEESIFTGWSAGPGDYPRCSGTGECYLTMNEEGISVVATFEKAICPYLGSLSGTWSGVCSFVEALFILYTYNLEGEFSMSIDENCVVSGIYYNSVTGSIIGEVKRNGSLSAIGETDEEFSWLGALTLSDNTLSGTGKWNTTFGNYICQGTWEGTGTPPPEVSKITY